MSAGDGFSRNRALPGSCRWFRPDAGAKDSFTAVRCLTLSLSQKSQTPAVCGLPRLRSLYKNLQPYPSEKRVFQQPLEPRWASHRVMAMSIDESLVQVAFGLVYGLLLTSKHLRRIDPNRP
jgi:hypothetical protein